MKLTLTVTDQRQVFGRNFPNDKTEDYDRVSVVDLEATRDVLAGFLRAVADDISPQYVAVEGTPL
jgi:hypothetical protein